MSGSKRRRRHEKSGVVPRGAAVPAELMLLAFDVDCGELIQGHRFVARGLRDQGTVMRPDEPGECRGFSLEYELVPGIPKGNDERLFSYLVAIQYEADVPLPWEPIDGGAIAPFEGGASTHGSRGDWPLPESARVLRFVLSGIDRSTGYQREVPDGVLIVDLRAASAIWKPLRQRGPRRSAITRDDGSPRPMPP